MTSLEKQLCEGVARQVAKKLPLEFWGHCARCAMQSDQRSRVNVFDVDQAVAEIITEAVVAYLNSHTAKWKPRNIRTAHESREHRKVVEEFISWRQQSGLKGLRAIKGFRKFKAGNAGRNQAATRRVA